ncbi:DinB family protein [Risungbinella massiliensis]|uniref:DinB family protein n=1 Tax=Risungbinella massiliensis TaxID=1329796 RepID=UPI00069ABA3F|nr:DinB family protein [Risungbinella massiliensis]
MDSLYLIQKKEDYCQEIGHLVSMMNYVRDRTKRTVDGLSIEQLDMVVEKDGNSIGALLLHMAAVEVYYQALTFEGRGLNKEEESKWLVALNLGEKARKEIRGYPLSYYLSILDDTREHSLTTFRELDQSWLFREIPFWQNKPSNHYFCWFHVIEDEIRHVGQIVRQKKRIV